MVINVKGREDKMNLRQNHNLTFHQLSDYMDKVRNFWRANDSEWYVQSTRQKSLNNIEARIFGVIMTECLFLKNQYCDFTRGCRDCAIYKARKWVNV